MAAVLVMLAFVTQAQPAAPRIAYAYPAGGRQGATFQVVIGGQRLNGATNVHVSGAGLKARITEYTRPLTQKELNEYRDKVKLLEEKKRALAKGGKPPQPDAKSPPGTNVWTVAEERMLAELRNKLASAPDRRANPAMAETVTLEVTLAHDAELGDRELRLETEQGLSNPLAFIIGQFQEFSEASARRTGRPGSVLRARFRRDQQSEPPEQEMNISLPASVNGQIMPGDIDRFRFHARKGQKLVVVVSARELIPYLADAVPGWFQATLALYDADGKELAYADDYRFNPDPVLEFEIPREGEYVIEIKDAIYRGREDFVYRITLGELPFVTSEFPLGMQAGTKTTVEMQGWNLADGPVTQEFKEPGIYPLSVANGRYLSNPAPFAVDTLPECDEREPNDQPRQAQVVTPPIIINGRIMAPGDADVYRFDGRAGERIVAEVLARRLNSPLDSILGLTDADGGLLASNDDHEDKGAGLTTHHADSWLSMVLPANGAYHLRILDAQQKGGPEFAYRLRISPPRPDFDLRVVPSSITIRGGGAIPLTVYALRKDGFTNAITLDLRTAPEGFTLSGARVPPNQDQVRVSLTAPPTAPQGAITLKLEGHALIQGNVVTRPAVPADDLMQAFAYHHLVPARELKVAVSGRPGPRANVRIVGDGPTRIPVGGTARILLAGPSRAVADMVHFELNEPPAGISIRDSSVTREGIELVVQSDAKVKPGLAGNLIVNAFAQPSRAAEQSQARQRPRFLRTLPAIPFEVVER